MKEKVKKISRIGTLANFCRLSIKIKQNKK